jgi:hypothetical protein
LGAKNDKKPTPPNLKTLLFHLTVHLIFFRLASPYCPQTPKNGGFKNLFNQTIKVFVSQNQTYHFIPLRAGAPKNWGLGAKKCHHIVEHLQIKSVLFLKFSYFRKIKLLKDEICSNKGNCTVFKKQHDAGRKNSLD